MRLSDFGLMIGVLPSGRDNAITDVEGVRVGHRTVLEGDSIRTGVTVLEPRPGPARLAPCFAGVHVLNGNGDATGFEWIREAGFLTSPIAITNTHSVGVVRDALVAADRAQTGGGDSVHWCMPVVLETFDGYLNDIWAQVVTRDHVFGALASAAGGPVEMGCVGGGTGMICHDFKGGIGSASRVTPGGWAVGALVQANHGAREDLRVAGHPVGRELAHLPSPDGGATAPGTGSIVVILATDAPLLPHQCARLAQRAGIGIARAGGGVSNSSGDLFIAFATGNRDLPVADYAKPGPAVHQVSMVDDGHISELFAAAADAVEESILNALFAATDMTGLDGHTVPALSRAELEAALRRCGWRG